MDVLLDKLHEECGIFGIFGHAEASTLTQLGLFALQHRGQEACGIVSADQGELYQFRSTGLIADVLTEEVLKKLGKNYEFHRYDGAGHGFFAHYRPAYRSAQAADGWAKVLAFYQKHLG